MSERDRVRILHVTNIVSHHQLPLARCLADAAGHENFRFLVTQPPDPQRQRMGWTSNDSEPWILRAGEDQEHRTLADAWWEDADVVLCGDRLLDRFEGRIRRRKLTLHMSERWWKPPIGMARMLHPRFLTMAMRFRRLAHSPWFHYLAMGGYAGSDMRRLAAFPDRMWTWGYFTSVPEPLPECRPRQGPLKILWAGRMLGWKRVDTLVQAAAELKRRHVDYHVTLIGDGPRHEQLTCSVQRLGLENKVTIQGSVPAPEVLSAMRHADVYVLPSNGYEGWGAVLNEAMTQGCAVVASRDAGSAKTIIRDGANGLLFPTGDWKALADLLCRLHADEPMRLRLAKAGQQTIAQTWSPEVGAKRFLAVCEALLSDRPAPRYEDGPMSPASEV